MTENEVTKKMAAGFYRDIDLIDSSTEPDSIQKKLNELEGVKGTGADYLNTYLKCM
jgi:hypothetical protein